MSATKRLRALLDERGVEWSGGLPTETIVREPIDALYVERPDGRMHVYFRSYMTPEEAVAATLGAGTCHAVWEADAMTEDERVGEYVCSECGETFNDGHGEFPRYCPNCGKAVVG